MSTPQTNAPVDLYDTTYGNFQQDVREESRRRVYTEDIGQNSWLTAGEHQMFFNWLELGPESTVLEVGAGSGGPALFLAKTTGARVVGIDVNESGVATATDLARAQGLQAQVEFRHADGAQPLPFPAESFDALICIDAINHLPDRAQVLREWYRALRPGGRLLYTDPIVVTGLLTKEEIAMRASIGYFLFAPPGENERVLTEAGFSVLRAEDRTENMAEIGGRWLEVRQRLRDNLLRMEGEETYQGLQRFFGMVHRLASEGRLSRIAFLARKPRSQTKPI